MNAKWLWGIVGMLLLGLLVTLTVGAVSRVAKNA